MTHVCVESEELKAQLISCSQPRFTARNKAPEMTYCDQWQGYADRKFKPRRR